MDLAHIFILFILYSFIGWVCEVIYCSVPARRFINRGFLHGPICPVYGFGGIFVISFLEPYENTWVPLFLAGMFVTTVLEYATSFIMEKLFHAKWWDYSNLKFNIHGRVCLLNSILFGVMTVFAIHFVNPALMALIHTLHKPAAVFISSIIGIMLITDIVITLRTLAAFNIQLEKLQAFTDTLKVSFEKEEWFVPKSISTMLESIIERAKYDSSAFSSALLEKVKSFSLKDSDSIRLIKAFPHLQFEKNSMQLDHIKLQLRIDLAVKREELIAAYNRRKGRTVSISSRADIEERILHQSEQKKQKEKCTAENSFARELNYYKLFWTFFLCSILGTILETFFCLLRYGVFQSRTGLLYGPLNPVYGFAGVIMTILLYRLRTKRDMVIFGGSVIIGGVFEFLCSFLQERILGTVSWDYSFTFFSMFGGRTNFVYCIFWGFLGLFWVKDLFPEISKSIENLPAKLGKPLTWILSVLMLANMLISFAAIDRMGNRHLGRQASNNIEKFLDDTYPDQLIQKIYPTMKFSDE